MKPKITYPAPGQIQAEYSELKTSMERRLELTRVIDKLQKENEQLREELKQYQERANRFFVAGSDGCSNCEAGRVTYWKKTMLCFDCEKAKQLVGGEDAK